MEAAWWFPGGSEGSVCLQCGTPELAPWVKKVPWRSKYQLTPVFLPGESDGQRSPIGYSSQGHKESDTTECLYFLSFYCVGLREVRQGNNEAVLPELIRAIS